MSMSARNSRIIARHCARLCVLLCVSPGCAVGPNFQRPPPPAVTHYSNGADPAETASAQGTAQKFTPGAHVAADWWRLFQSAQLDAVMKEAVVNNPGLHAAQASLRASQNNLRSGYGIFYPSIDANAAATRERYSGANLGANLPSSVFSVFTVSATDS